MSELNIYDFGIIVLTIIVDITIIVLCQLWNDDAHRKEYKLTLLIASVGFLALCYLGYNNPRNKSDFKKQEIYVDNHKATCYKPDQIDDNLCNVEIPDNTGSYRRYLHSRNCPCFRPLKDTVVVDGHKYLKMHKAYYHAPNCN